MKYDWQNDFTLKEADLYDTNDVRIDLEVARVDTEAGLVEYLEGFDEELNDFVFKKKYFEPPIKVVFRTFETYDIDDEENDGDELMLA